MTITSIGIRSSICIVGLFFRFMIGGFLTASISMIIVIKGAILYSSDASSISKMCRLLMSTNPPFDSACASMPTTTLLDGLLMTMLLTIVTMCDGVSLIIARSYYLVTSLKLTLSASLLTSFLFLTSSQYRSTPRL